MYDFLVVGAGLSGATFARVATDKGHKCLVIDKRNHIGGNCATIKKRGIDIHLYGPHIAHMSKLSTYNFFKRFSMFKDYVHKVKTIVDNKEYTIPINMNTFRELWGIEEINEAVAKIESLKLKINQPANFQEWVLSQVGEEIYYKFYYGYTKKQWGKEPEEITIDVAKRLPIRFNWDDNYFNDKYTILPIAGWNNFFVNMLDNIDVDINTEYEEKEFPASKYSRVVFTGEIDRLLDYRFGKLDYRSLEFSLTEEDIYEMAFLAKTVVHHYPSLKIPFTRVTEHYRFMPEKVYLPETTYKTYEFPCDYEPDKNHPIYPINNSENKKRYQHYKNALDSRIIPLGRLGEYKYMDMNVAVENAIAVAEAVC